MARRLLGVFVEPLHPQSEGVEPVLDVLESAGTTAIVLTLNVGRLAAPGRGVRMPPLHVDGHRRVYSRPVWGRDHLDVEYFPAADADPSLFLETPYRPRPVPVPPEVDRAIPRRLIDAAQRRGMAAYVQIKPFMPKGLLPEDQPVYPDGMVPQPPQVTLAGSPASPAIRAYGKALIRDTLRSFPGVDGLFLDWAEFGAYAFEDLFTDAGSHAAAMARSLGYGWDEIWQAALAAWATMHRLTRDHLQPAESAFARLFETVAGWETFLRFKADVVASFYREARNQMDRDGLSAVHLMARGWPPPWNAFSGMDYGALAGVCASATPKLFAFDYCSIPRWYGQTIQRWNPALPEAAILDALVAWLDLPDTFNERRFDLYRIPAEDEPHPVGIDAYRRRVKAVIRVVGGRCAIQPFAHAHMPDGMWREKLRMLRDLPVDGIWIQMYGYLSGSKLQILREEWR